MTRALKADGNPIRMAEAVIRTDLSRFSSLRRASEGETAGELLATKSRDGLVAVALQVTIGAHRGKTRVPSPLGAWRYLASCCQRTGETRS